MRFIAVFLSSVLLAGCGISRFAPHDVTVFDELMPRPVKVEMAAAGEASAVPATALGNETVIRGAVPGVPAATADEEPFTDQEYVMREPTPTRLRKGWNHVKLTIPNPSAKEKSKHRWVGTFIPVAGTTDHPQEVPGLEYASHPQP